MGENGKIDFLLFGYNGVNNTGSEAKLLTTLADLREVVGKNIGRLGRISILTQNIENQRRYVPDTEIELVEISPASLIRIQKITGQPADVFLLSEGSTFIDHFSSIFCWMFCYAARFAKRAGRGVVAYSNDCGHLKPRNQKILRDTINNSVDLVMLRNPDAVSRMKEYGVTRDIKLVADGAYMYPTPSQEFIQGVWKKLALAPNERPVVGICPKEFFWWPVKIKFIGPKEDLYNWPAYHSWTKEGRENSQRYVDQNAAYADWCVDKYGADVALISMEHMDYPPTKRIHEAMKHKDRARIVASDEFDVDGIVAVLSALKLQVTTRYHSTVLSSPFGVPMITVSSDTRCEAVFRELDAMDYYIDYVKHPNRYPEVNNLFDLLVEKTESLVRDEQAWRDKIKESHQVFLKRAQDIRTHFQEWLEKDYLPSSSF
jgi:polysaccharide pyruvyl transferase WcaK-like protein